MSPLRFPHPSSSRLVRNASTLLGLALLVGACADGPDELSDDLDADAEELRDEPVYELVAADYPYQDGDSTVCSVWEADLGDEGVHQWTEFYLIDRMNEELAQDPQWQAFVGLDRVVTCDDAREYQELRLEFEETLPAEATYVAGMFPEEPGVEQVDKIGEDDGQGNHGAVVRLTRNLTAINNGTSNGCSGTIIHPQVILTAAHCFSAGTATTWVRREEGGVVQPWYSDSAIFYRHASYTGVGDAGDDIGMLVFPAPLPDITLSTDTMRVLVSPLAAGDDVVFYGWGIANHQGTGAGVLRYGNALLNWASSRHVTDEVIQGGARICKGDSGGTIRLDRGYANVTYDLVGGMASEYEVGSDFCPYPGNLQRWAATADKIDWIELRLLANGIDFTPDGTACNRYSQSGRDYMRCW